MSEPFWTPLGPTYPPLDVGPELSYAEFTAPVSVTVTSDATSVLVCAAPAFTADGTSQYLIEFFAPLGAAPNVGAAILQFVLYVDGVSQGILGQVVSSGAGGSPGSPIRLTRRTTPAAGAHTYQVRAYVSSSTGTVQAGAGGAAGAINPGFLRITKVPSAVVQPATPVPPLVVVTSLPASPVDGQQVVLVDSLTNPTYAWKLLFIAAKPSNKWVFVGGSQAFVSVATLGNYLSSAFGDLATLGPDFTTPVAGDWEFTVSCEMVNLSANDRGAMSYKVGAGAASSAWALALSNFSGAFYMSASRTSRQAGVPAGTLIRCQYAVENNSSCDFRNRSLAVRPVALGG